MTGISRTAGGQWMSLSLCSCIIFSFGLLLLFPLSNLVIVIFFFFPLSASYGFFFFWYTSCVPGGFLRFIMII
jgi:hypothetical protein